MTRTEREKKVIRQMIEIYCRKHHRPGDLCTECEELLTYAFRRIENCPQGASKTSCRKCTIHCYAPAQKQRIKDVMRYVGPRMIFIHPLTAIRHIISELK